MHTIEFKLYTFSDTNYAFDIYIYEIWLMLILDSF